MFPPMSRWSTLRTALAITVCVSLISTMAWSARVGAQGQSEERRVGKPRREKPEGELPDLAEVQGEAQLERETQVPIPSTMRSPKVPLEPWNGRRVGDREPPDKKEQVFRAHARKRFNLAPPSVLDEQFVQNFFTWTVSRAPSASELTYWNDQLRVAYAPGQASVKLAAVEFGKTLFESAEYAARNRNDHWYVYDLYKTFLMREPDASGWANWESMVPINGRVNVRRAFEEAPEFAGILASIVPNGAASANAASLVTARVEPRNQPGQGLLARDATWSVPLLSLPGRNGLDLGLGLSYSSLVWTRSGPYLHFDEDNGAPSPGFRLGFPSVQRRVFDAQRGKNAYLLITASGQRVELIQVGTSNVYEAADSSYLQLTDNSPSLLLRATDGTQLSFYEVDNEYRCRQVKDRNGNYLTVADNGLGQLTGVSDTLGRVITFNYDSNANLISITQAWNGQPAHQWVSFGWGTRTMQSSFTGGVVIGTKNGTVLPVITQVALNDTSRFTFDYTNSLQVSVIRSYFGAIERNATSFTYETPAGDVPRLLDSRLSARNWTGVNGVPAQVITQYSVAGDGACVLTAPDGTVYKEYYGTGWQKGLTTLSEVWSGGVKQKWTTTTWAQDNATVGYELNPRVTETNVYDASGNRRRTVIDYGSYAQWGLPYAVKEYAADGVTEIRQTLTDYNLSQTYLDQRIIGLVSQVQLKSGSTFHGKITYGYDDPARLLAPPAAATQHDTAYSTLFTARGNITSVSRWDATDINNAAKKLTSYANYYITGTPVSSTDPSGHQSSIAYADSFSDSVNRNTFAYPTTVTDANGFSSSAQYNFDTGATTRTQSPAPAGQAQGAIQTMSYNTLGQLERITTTNNGAYKRFWYGADYVASYATVNNVADELYSIEVVDGLGRVIGAAGNHPGSTGGYRLLSTIYNQMGRLWKQSNPTEVNSSWVPVGDDVAGMYYTQQTYDWKGRPLVTTNTDLTTKTAAYAGCGCAGGEVVTLTDEGTLDGGVSKRRQQKIYSDVLGRPVKTELLNWQGGSVYSATVSTYNIRDQVIQIREYAGAEGSGTYQDTTMTYDGYGRLKTKHVPEQNAGANTVWTYNPDDTLNTITDARGATTSFGYTGTQRHLVKSLTHTLSGSATISISFDYDAAGNRRLMTDALGSVSYTYDQLSQLTSETRTFAVGNFTIGYGYNLAGQLTSVTDPFGATFSYTRDAQGRLKTVSGSPFAGFTSYITDVQYRTWGAPKSVVYNGTTSTIGYNSRLQPSQFRLTANSNGNSVMRENYSYFADGTLASLADLDDTPGSNPPATLRFLSRSYSYDHVGRVIDVHGTGSGSMQGVPFAQTYAYDQFDNLTSRSGSYYNYTLNPPTTDIATYVNDRRTNWGYNAEGQVVSTPSTSTDSPRTMTYDAAGRLVSSVETNQFNTVTYSAAYDGDGELAFESSVTNPGTTQTSYIVRSTVLEDVLTRLDQAGNKKITHVPAEGLLFATQRTDSTGSFVWLTQRNPLGISETSKAVYDPLGNYIPFQASGDPRPPAGSFSSASMGGLSSSQANPFSYAVGCMLDGIPTSCNKVVQAINNGQGKTLQIDGRQNPDVLLASMGVFVVEYRSDGNKTRPFWRPYRKPSKKSPYNIGRDEQTWAFALVSFQQHPKNPQIDPKLKAAIEDCASEMYQVTASGTGFSPSRKGAPGSFQGTRLDENGVQQEVSVVNENTAYDGWEIARRGRQGDWTAGITFWAENVYLRSNGEIYTQPSGYSPYRNFTAKDLHEKLPKVSWVNVQVWELGNSLAIISGKFKGSLMSNPKNEPGKLLSDCVRKKYGRSF